MITLHLSEHQQRLLGQPTDAATLAQCLSPLEARQAEDCLGLWAGSPHSGGTRPRDSDLGQRRPGRWWPGSRQLDVCGIGDSICV